MTTLVLATDGSEYSIAAAKFLHSAKLVSAGTKVHVVHVSTPLTGRAASLVGAKAVEEWHAQESAEAIDPVLKVLLDLGIEAEAHSLVGHAPREIAEYAQKVDAQMIVLGAHGRGVLLDAVIGSVAGRVLSMAKRPVLLVK
ncbi:MAG: universal stress protein [Pigmentiphaga sp.]